MTFVTTLATAPLSGAVAIAASSFGATLTYALNPTTENAIGIIPMGVGLKYGATFLDEGFYLENTFRNYVEAYEVYDNVSKVNNVTSHY